MTWIQLTSGRGPEECQLAVSRIAVKLIELAEARGLTATFIDSETTAAGMLSCLIALEGDDAAAFAGSWQGTIEWKCVSPLRPETRRKNWFIGAQMIAEPPVQPTWRDTDIRFETFRSSGPGGQHVNTTSSAVRVTHLPTGLTAQAQEERSQHRNKSLALGRLTAQIAANAAGAARAIEQSKWSNHNTVIRGKSVMVFVGKAFRLRGNTLT